MVLSKIARSFLIASTAVITTPAVLACAGASPQAASPSTEDTQLSRMVRAAVEDKVTGVVLVAKNGEVIAWESIGAPGDSAPAPNPNAAFDVGSIAKTFTAVAILRLAEQGTIELDAPVRRYLPELPATASDVTIRHTLNMDAGWPPYLSGDDMTMKTAAEAVTEITGIQREKRAGEGYAYSNVGFTVLGLLIERVTGESYPQALRRLVFRPAGMSRTGFFGEQRGDAVSGYVDGRPVGSPVEWPLTWAVLGAGQVVSTAGDLLKFNRAIVAGDLLGPNARSIYLSPGADTGGRGPFRSPDRLATSYGSGLYHWRDRAGRKIHMHGGASDFGFHSMMLWRENDDVLLIGLFNSGDPGSIRAELTDAVFRGVAASEQ